MFYFNTREKAKAWAAKTGYKFVDLGAGAKRRWAVECVRWAEAA